MPIYSRYSGVSGPSLTFVGVAPITVTNVLGTVTTSMTQASATTDGWLSAADWINFNSKQPAGSYANTALSNLIAPTAINASLLFNPDNTHDIGADGASRPAAIHAANHVTAPVIRARDNVPGAGQHDITVRAGNGTTGNKDGGVLTLAGGTPSGTGTAGYVSLLTNGLERIRITPTGNVGINTTSPNAQLQINNAGSQLGLSVFSTSTNNTAELYNQGTTNYTLALNSAANSAQTGASIGGYFARGTLGTRSQTLADDTLLSISASGHTGSAVAGISAGIALAADENTTSTAYGGQIVFATTPNSTPGGFPVPRVYIKHNGNVGIGAIPTINTERLLVANVAGVNSFIKTRGTGAIPVLRGERQNGTLASPTAVVSGNELIQFSGSGYDGSAYTASRASISMWAAENWSGTNQGTYTTFSTTPIASILNTERMRITDAGNVGIGTAAPTQTLEVSGGTKLDGSLNVKSIHAQTGIADVITVTTTDYYVGINCSLASKTVNLPSAVTVGSGRQVVIKDESGTAFTNNIVITPNGVETIDGSPSFTLKVNYESASIISDGSNWFVY